MKEWRRNKGRKHANFSIDSVKAVVFQLALYRNDTFQCSRDHLADDFILYFLGFHTQSLMEFLSRWQCYLLSVCLALSSASSSGFQSVSICYWDPNSARQVWMVRVWLLQLPHPQTFSCNTYLARYLWIKAGQMPDFFFLFPAKCPTLSAICCLKSYVVSGLTSQNSKKQRSKETDLDLLPTARYTSVALETITRP